jgi:beta-N-acetylhexosaminidase
MVGFEGHEPSPDVKHLLSRFGVGSVILFARNVDSPGQVAELVRELRPGARRGPGLPLLVAVDREGGRVGACATVDGVAPLVGLSARRDLARRLGAALAGAAACGIQWDSARRGRGRTRATRDRGPIVRHDPDLVRRLGGPSSAAGQPRGRVRQAFPGHGTGWIRTSSYRSITREAGWTASKYAFRRASGGVASIMTRTCWCGAGRPPAGPCLRASWTPCCGAR